MEISEQEVIKKKGNKKWIGRNKIRKREWINEHLIK